MSRFVIKLLDQPDGHVVRTDVEAVRDKEAAAIGLKTFRDMGIIWDRSDKVDVIDASSRVQSMTIKDILDWLTKTDDGQAFAEAEHLGTLTM